MRKGREAGGGIAVVASGTPLNFAARTPRRAQRRAAQSYRGAPGLASSPARTLFHFSAILRAAAGLIAVGIGNRSCHENGRHASMMSFECVVSPRSLASG